MLAVRSPAWVILHFGLGASGSPKQSILLQCLLPEGTMYQFTGESLDRS